VGTAAVPPTWPDVGSLQREQEEVGSLDPPPWAPPDRPLVAAAAFVAFARGEAGPGAEGDRAWVGAAVVAEDGRPLRTAVVRGRAGGPYRPGLLAHREGRMTVEALATVIDGGPAVDVLVLDATGRDHPLRCGLAVHLGWLLDLPSVGVTHRLLTRRDAPVPRCAGRGPSEVVHGPEGPVARWVCTRVGARPVVAHAGWRTDPDVAAQVVLRTSARARTPEPLRRARELARVARAVAGAGRPTG